MGTSRKWTAPAGGPWRGAHNRMTRSLKDLQDRLGSLPRPVSGQDSADTTRPDVGAPPDIGNTGNDQVVMPGGAVAATPEVGRGGTAPTNVDDIGNERVEFPDRGGIPAQRASGDAEPLHIEGLSPSEVARVGQSYRNALAMELSATPDCLGLRTAVEEAGYRLVNTLEAIDQRGLGWLVPFETVPAEERTDEFIARFTNQVAHSVGLTVDAVVRQAAADTAYRLLELSPALRHAVETADKRAGWIDDDLFCMIYRLFFANAVTVFLQSVIAAEITLVMPVLPAVDPAGHIANWIAKQIVSIIPTPCEERNVHTAATSLADLGRSLIKEAVERALDIDTNGQS